MEGTLKFSDTLLSPVKGYPQSEDHKPKPEVKYNNLFSPYPQDIKTPMKDTDWNYYQKRVNGETPNISSRIFSPIMSSNQQKIGYGSYAIHPRMLFNDCSPFKPQVVLSTPYQNNNLSTVDRDRDQTKENNRNDFLLFQCKNLATQFESVVNNELSFMEKSECPNHFAQIKQRLFNDVEYSIQDDNKGNNDKDKDNDNGDNSIICLGLLNYELHQSFQSADACNKINDLLYNDNEGNPTANANDNDDAVNEPEVQYLNNTHDIVMKHESDCLECKCTKSKCLKLYCECFANGKYCNGCSCINCLNTKENDTIRRKAYCKIITKNPKALHKIQATKKSWNCKCKNSSCQKNYCDCFQNSKFCSSKCKCFNCRNKPLTKRMRGSAMKKKVRKEKEKESKESKVKAKLKERKASILNSSSCNKRKSHIKDETPSAPVTSALHYDAIYTPQKKNYRAMKTELQNSISTAAYTALSFDNRDKSGRAGRGGSNKKNQGMNVCKKFDMKDDDDNTNTNHNENTYNALKGLF